MESHLGPSCAQEPGTVSRRLEVSATEIVLGTLAEGSQGLGSIRICNRSEDPIWVTRRPPGARGIAVTLYTDGDGTGTNIVRLNKGESATVTALVSTKGRLGPESVPVYIEASRTVESLDGQGKRRPGAPLPEGVEVLTLRLDFTVRRAYVWRDEDEPTIKGRVSSRRGFELRRIVERSDRAPFEIRGFRGTGTDLVASATPVDADKTAWEVKVSIPPGTPLGTIRRAVKVNVDPDTTYHETAPRISVDVRVVGSATCEPEAGVRFGFVKDRAAVSPREFRIVLDDAEDWGPPKIVAYQAAGELFALPESRPAEVDDLRAAPESSPASVRGKRKDPPVRWRSLGPAAAPGEHRFEVTLDPDAPPGAFAGRLWIRARAPGGAVAETGVALTGVVEGER